MHKINNSFNNISRFLIIVFLVFISKVDLRLHLYTENIYLKVKKKKKL